MGYDDEYEYEDVEEDNYDEDFDGNDPDDEEVGASSQANPFSKPPSSGGNPFARPRSGGSALSGNSPFSRPSGSTSSFNRPSSGGSNLPGRRPDTGPLGSKDDDDSDSGPRRFPSPPPRSGGSVFGGKRPGTGPLGSNDDDDDKGSPEDRLAELRKRREERERELRSGGGGTTFGAPRSGGGTTFGAPRTGGSKPEDRDKRSSSGRLPGSVGSSRPGTGPLGGGKRPGTGPLGGKKDDDDKSSSSSRLPGSSGRPGTGSLGGGNRPGTGPLGGKREDDKKPSRPLGGGSPFGAKKDADAKGGKPAASKDAGKDDGGDKPSPSDRLSNLRSRFGNFGGGKGEDGDKDKKIGDGGDGPSIPGVAAAAGALGGLRGRLPFGGGGGDGKEGDGSKKPASGKGDGGEGKAGGSPLGGLRNRLPFGGGDDGDSGSKPAPSRPAPSGARPVSASAQSAAPAKPRFGSRAKPDTPPEKKADGGDGGGLGGRLAGLTAGIPFLGGGEAAKPASKTARQSKAPRVQNAEGGLSLDRKLDILGVGLVLGSLALFFSSLSTTQGIITEAINNFLSELLGWGWWAVPVVMFLVGMWLIVRHFGDEPPVIDPLRVAGLILTYVGLLVMFQFIESLSYVNVTLQDLPLRLEFTIEAGRGGGWLGAQAYFLMLSFLGEIFAFVLMVFALIIGLLLTFDVSVSEIAIISISLWRSMRAASRRQSERRAVRRQAAIAQRQERMAALAAASAAETSDISVTKPEPQALPAGEQAALPSGDDRAIPITMGGRTVNAPLQNEAVPVANNGEQQSPPPRKGRGGLFGGGALVGGLAAAISRGGGNDEKADEQPASPQPAPTQAPPVQMPPAAQVPPPQPNIAAQAAQGQPSVAPAAPQSPNPTQPAQPAAADDPAERPTPAATPAFAEIINRAGPQNTATPPLPTFNEPGQNQDDQQQPAAAASQPPASRSERLNALRQGLTQHPQQAATPAGTNGGDNGDKADEPNVNGQEKPTVSNTVTRPDKLKPAPAPPPGMASSPPVSGRPTVSGQVQGVKPPRRQQSWNLPDYSELLSQGSEQDFDRQLLVDQARIIEETLRSFGAPGRVVEINTGPVITQFGVEPDYLVSNRGKRSRVKVGAIAQLDRDLQLALGAKSIRVEAPVPGKGYVGIEVPNAKNALVSLRDVMDSEQFRDMGSPLTIALGQSVDGAPVAANLASMPHMLIAGTTGSGKSVCINAIICSLLTFNTPNDLKFIMVDPKRVELTGYNGVPHLVAPVVVELERIVGVLKWVTREMDERFKRFSTAGARNIEDFNKHLPAGDDKMPYIVVIIDELADLMMLAPEETERTISRIAALARATGIHLVIATQRPSVDVVTGLIKANFPARAAFAVAGSVDSRVILDQPGAERLLGKGDMLYLSGNSPAALRLQGVYVSDEEIDNIVRYWKSQAPASGTEAPKGMAPLTLDPASAPPRMTPSGVSGVAPSLFDNIDSGTSPQQQAFWDDRGSTGGSNGGGDADDEMYDEAVALVQRLNKASVSLLQRRLRIGYTRASRLIDIMEERGIVGPQESGSKPREVLKQAE